MLWNMIKARLGEASTWKGILSLATGAGLALTGQQQEAIVTAIIAVYAALSIILPDKFGK
jgi:hypothetical protein